METMQIFKNHKVEVFKWNSLILFNPYDVGACLDLEESSVRNYLASMNEKQVIKLKNLDVLNTDIRKLNNAGEKFLTESGVYKLIFKSRKPEAEEFQCWVTDVVLPQIRKTGTYLTNQQLQIPFPDIVQSIQIIANDLKVNDASKIIMYTTLYKDYNLPTNFLPKYEFNGNRDIKPATELLKRFNLELSAKAFNNLMIANGYLEERTRNSRADITKVKKYKALTEKGLKYGENAVCVQCQKETQPLYYTDTFEELFDIVSGKNEIVV